MGMVFEMHAIPVETVDQLRNAPDAIDGVLESAVGSFDLDKDWDLVRYLIDGTLIDGTPVDETPVDGSEPGAPTDPETAEAAGAAVISPPMFEGDEKVGRDDGYGQPALLLPATVKSFAATLRDLDPNVVDRRLQFENAEEIEDSDFSLYCFYADEIEDLKEYLPKRLADLKRFFAEASERGNAVVTMMT